MGKIKIGLIILTSIALVGLIVSGVVSAKPESPKNPKEEYVQDEIIVKFKGDVEPFRVIKVPEGKVGEKIKEHLARKDVVYAEPNYIAYTQMIPNDPYYIYQWHLDNPVYGGIGMEEAWDISTGSNSVVVAIVDTGIAYENYGKYCQASDLAQTCFVPGYDFVNNDSHPNDDNRHGTHVAGTVAQSTNNSLGVAGAAFNTCLMPVKVLNSRGSGTYTQVANGIYYAVKNGAKVINLSLGGSSDSATLKDAVAYAYNKGVTVIAACGNEKTATCVYPAAYDDYVIAVGATQYDEAKAPYSNYGPSLDLVAPGGNNSLDQNKDGYADGVLQQTFASSYQVCSFSFYFFQGTSMATPHVSGVAALIIANGTAATPDEVRDVLEGTAEDLGVSGRDNSYGWGLVDAAAALGWTSTPPAPECTVDTDCNDNNLCTNDSCNTATGNCVFTNNDANTCGIARDCPADQCDPNPPYENWLDYPADGHDYCSAGACIEYSCQPIATYDATCDPDDDNDGVLDVNDACPTNYGTDCNGCPNPCSGCAVMSCEVGTLIPPTCVAGTCSDTVCPTNGCGVGNCANNEYGTYTTASNVCNVTDNIGTCTENPCTLTCTPDPACKIQAMHVANIEIGIAERYRGWYKAGTATITIEDANGNPVQGATVYGQWSGAASDSDSGVTDEVGQVTFQSDYKWARNSLTFTLCVENVEKTDWTYDSSVNVETCDSAITSLSSSWSR